jgi:hypothetical protein
MKVFGWVCCRADIFKCTLRLDQAVFHAPVGYPRPDVFRAINPDSRYPFMNSYFCGVDANFAFSERKLVGISGLTCRAALSDKKGTIFAERMFEFDQDGKASLS